MVRVLFSYCMYICCFFCYRKTFNVILFILQLNLTSFSSKLSSWAVFLLSIFLRPTLGGLAGFLTLGPFSNSLLKEIPVLQIARQRRNSPFVELLARRQSIYILFRSPKNFCIDIVVPLMNMNFFQSDWEQSSRISLSTPASMNASRIFSSSGLQAGSDTPR